MPLKNVMVVPSENSRPLVKRIDASLKARTELRSTLAHNCEKASNADPYTLSKWPSSHQLLLLVDPTPHWPTLVHKA